jgi:hypothetical protein
MIMGDFQHAEGRGSLWPNKKREGKRDPDVRGTGLYRGERIRFAGWLDDKGGPHYSLTIQHDEDRAPAPAGESPLLGSAPAVDPPAAPKPAPNYPEPEPPATDGGIPF